MSTSPLSVNAARKQLDELSRAGHGETPLAVAYNGGRVTIGVRPSVAIIGIQAGFDWDAGRVFLQPEKPLGLDSDGVRDLARLVDGQAGLLWRIKSLVEEHAGEGIPPLVQIGELIAARKAGSGMTSAVEVLKRLEWSGRYSICTGGPCCPECRGIKPGHGKDERGVPPDNTGHRDSCDLAKALSGTSGEAAKGHA